MINAIRYYMKGENYTNAPVAIKPKLKEVEREAKAEVSSDMANVLVALTNAVVDLRSVVTNIQETLTGICDGQKDIAQEVSSAMTDITGQYETLIEKVGTKQPVDTALAKSLISKLEGEAA